MIEYFLAGLIDLILYVIGVGCLGFIVTVIILLIGEKFKWW